MTPFPDALVPGASPLLAAVGWVVAVLIGPLGTSVAVIAVAGIGFRMLTGDASVRQGLRVVMGVFILFGAPLIARGLAELVQGGAGSSIAVTLPSTAPQARPTNPPGFDPYAGAAVPDQ